MRCIYWLNWVAMQIVQWHHQCWKQQTPLMQLAKLMGHLVQLVVTSQRRRLHLYESNTLNHYYPIHLGHSKRFDYILSALHFFSKLWLELWTVTDWTWQCFFGLHLNFSFYTCTLVQLFCIFMPLWYIAYSSYSCVLMFSTFITY